MERPFLSSPSLCWLWVWVAMIPNNHHSCLGAIILSTQDIRRYNWRQFAVVTSDIAGHDDFIQAVREEVSRMKEELNIK